MKKIGIFAIGALLFVSVACNKDNGLQPSTNQTSTEQKPSKTELANGGLTTSPDLIDNGSADKESNKTRPHNENETPTTYNPNKQAIKDARNDEVVNPYSGNTARNPRVGTRNDEVINGNNSDL